MSWNSRRTFQVYSEGIYHGLPDFPADLNGARAIVVGASGQSGQPLIEVLSTDPKRWTKVYALSRRPPKTSPKSNVEHVPLDLFKEPEKTAEILRQYQVQADYLFYFGYVRIPRQEDNDVNVFGDSAVLADVNGKIFENLLAAIDLAGIEPKRIVLQAGGKNYGVHQGHVSVPLREEDPRIELEPNFYYRHEDALKEYTRKHPRTSLNVVRPQWILSAVEGSDMTIFYPLAVYAAVQRKLNRPLEYPGDLRSWGNDHPISSGSLMGRFYEWLVLSPQSAGESFNFTDGSEFTFGKLWSILASWYGTDWNPPKEDAKYHETVLPLLPRSYGPRGKLRSSFNLLDWAREPATKEAWAELSKEHGLTGNPFDQPESWFVLPQWAMEVTWSWATSTDKSRKFGWFGHVDSIESMHEVFEKLAQMKMIPPMVK